MKEKVDIILWNPPIEKKRDSRAPGWFRPAWRPTGSFRVSSPFNEGRMADQFLFPRVERVGRSICIPDTELSHCAKIGLVSSRSIYQHPGAALYLPHIETS